MLIPLMFRGTPTRRHWRGAPHGSGGSVSAEYLLVSVLVGSVLFVGNPSIMTQLLNAMHTRFELFSILVAMP